MISTQRAQRAVAVAPHALAAQSAANIMREGGNALEAMVAAAATIASTAFAPSRIASAAERAASACGATAIAPRWRWFGLIAAC